MHDPQQTAYALARLPIGFSFFGHGLVRLPKIQQFAEGMAKAFENTWLPHVHLFSEHNAFVRAAR
ncbi:hypothetical protein [Haliangium ochraceum]|uniref:Uncharacterized protein n=1 Tax=Haliangium ochraceum (strain DSM 14365 / JCM 11303 / SMP-2) TaxID=502025 RepID=D0LS91_HALO1|nr:hypothetical protein [Haliangium ochraceum]ACY15590.1 hypothetical protein Hoch_3084 [Haliangium ochraceum DSM 14365]